jgi:hypothetical protein
VKHFQDEFRKDNSLKETPYPLDIADKRHWPLGQICIREGRGIRRQTIKNGIFAIYCKNWRHTILVFRSIYIYRSRRSRGQRAARMWRRARKRLMEIRRSAYIKSITNTDKVNRKLRTPWRLTKENWRTTECSSSSDAGTKRCCHWSLLSQSVWHHFQ